ncbi:MAG TPA: Crp/Fnr family transcriptional regulator [Thermomicrobiales bacterium]|nr:Crp/Fnr family transcriptional regulator [Thermomicrobiales bacterium]
MSGAERTKVWYLRRLDLFSVLAGADLAAMASLLDDRHFPAGAELLAARDRDCVYLVKDGAVRLYTAGDPRPVTLALLGPGRLFGLSSAIGVDDPALGAVTVAPSYVCRTTWPRLLELGARRPRMLLRLTRALAEQVFLAETWVERRRAGGPRTRLAGLLLELDDEFGEADDAGRRIRYRLTQADLARMVGVSRESANRALADFARAGWVGRERGRLLVRDRQALEGVTSDERWARLDDGRLSGSAR